MKKYWKNAKKNWKSQGNSSVQKSGNHAINNNEVVFAIEIKIIHARAFHGLVLTGSFSKVSLGRGNILIDVLQCPNSCLVFA